MKSFPWKGLALASCLLAVASAGRAQVIQLNATINAAQETTTSKSAATGSAVLLYNVAANTYTLTITLNNFPNTLVSSGISEAATGASGSVVNNLGAEAASYTRNGNTLTTSFSSPVAYAGTPLKLIQRGAYLNFTTAAFPSGEVRGQLIAQPIILTAIVTSAQEIPATRTSGVSLASGAAYINYDPGLNTAVTRVSLYNFTNTLTLSHYHEDPLNISGPVVLTFGGAAVYNQNGANLNQVFNQTYTGNPVTLLTGGAYVNFHSNIYPAGEIRGQVYQANEPLTTRIVNGSSLGPVGSAPLTTGFIVEGDQAVLTLITARGPSLTQFGVSGALANPKLSVFGAGDVLMATNTGWGSSFDSATISTLASPALLTNDSALLLVLQPGAYTAQVTSATNLSGTALIEVFDSR